MKLTKHAWTLWGIALFVTLILALVIPFVQTGTYWIAFLCSLAMFAVCAFAFVRAFRKSGTIESKLLGWPIFKVGYAALIAQIIIGFALMGLAALCPVWVAVIVEVAVFAVTAFSMTVKDAVREVVSASETKIADNTAAWKAIRARAAAIASATGKPELKKLAEEIRYADPMPTGLDGEIAQMLENLSANTDNGDITKLAALIEQRKELAKESKK